MAAITEPLRAKAAPSNPTGKARSEVIVMESMERLQVRPSTPDVVIHNLPTYHLIEVESHLDNPEPEEKDDWTPGG